MSPRHALPLRLEFALLGLIRRKPAYGYELLRDWHTPDGIGVIWHIRPGHLYAALDKLSKLGYLESKQVPGDKSPDRKLFQITSAGDDAFLNWMKTPVEAPRDLRQEFLAKLYFSNDVETSIGSELIHLQKEACLRWHANHQVKMNNETGFMRSVTSYRLNQVRSMLDWLEELDT